MIPFLGIHNAHVGPNLETLDITFLSSRRGDPFDSDINTPRCQKIRKAARIASAVGVRLRVFRAVPPRAREGGNEPCISEPYDGEETQEEAVYADDTFSGKDNVDVRPPRLVPGPSLLSCMPLIPPI